MSSAVPQAGPPPSQASLNLDDRDEIRLHSPALPGGVKAEQPQEEDRDAWWKLVSTQEMVDRLIEAIGQEDVLIVLLHLFALRLKGAMKSVNWQYSHSSATALSVAAGTDTPSHRIILQLLILAGGDIQPLLLRQEQSSAQLITPWARQTFRLWLEGDDTGFGEARRLFEMGPWAAEKHMTENPDYLDAVWPHRDKSSPVRTISGKLPSSPRQPRYFEQLSGGGASGGDKVRKSKKKSKKAWSMPPTESTIPPSSASTSFGPVAQDRDIWKPPIDVAPTKRQSARTRSEARKGASRGKPPTPLNPRTNPKLPAAPKKKPAPPRRRVAMPKEPDCDVPPAPHFLRGLPAFTELPSAPRKQKPFPSRSIKNEHPNHGVVSSEDQVEGFAPLENGRRTSGGVIEKAEKPSMAKKELRVKTAMGGQDDDEEMDHEEDEFVSDSQCEEMADRKADLHDTVDSPSQPATSHSLFRPGKSRLSSSPYPSSRTVYPPSRSTSPSSPTFRSSFHRRLPSQSSSAGRLSPSDLDTIRLSEILRLEMGEGAYEKAAKQLVLARMKGVDGAPPDVVPCADAETILRAYRLELELGKEVYGAEVKKVKLQAMRGI